MKPVETYYEIVVELLKEITQTQQENIKKAASYMTDVIVRDGLIYVFGTGGHSYIVSEEITSRAGGLTPVFPIWDPGISLSFGCRRSSAIERMPGYAQRVLENYPITTNDCIVIGNAYGINSCTIDTAMWAKEKGIKSIAITSPGFSKNIPDDHAARHPSKKNLFEVVDCYIDNKMPGLDVQVSPVSTILNCFVVNSLVAEVAAQLLDRGITPPIWMSGNIPGGDEANADMEAKLAKRVHFF